jgi:vacuolar protein sorting-associated protein 33A
LLRKSDGTKNVYTNVMRSLQLINDYESSVKQHEVSSIYAGYAPISIRIVQHASQTFTSPEETLPLTWEKSTDVMKLLAGAMFEHTTAVKGFKKKLKEPATLVVFIGGVTLAEVSTIRLLSRTTGTVTLIVGRRYSILTSSVISASKIINSMVPE